MSRREPTCSLDLQEKANCCKNPLVCVDTVERLDRRLVGLERREEDIAPRRVATASLPSDEQGSVKTARKQEMTSGQQLLSGLQIQQTPQSFNPENN